MANSVKQTGVTLIEIVIVLAIVGAMLAIAVPNLSQTSADQRLKSATRSIAGAFTKARGEAIRTGNMHIVFFQTDALGNPLFDVAGNAVPVLILDDGRPGSVNQNCRIDAGEIIGVIPAENGVNWGVSFATAAAPNDFGGGAIADGSSFRDPNSLDATWVLFLPAGRTVAFNAACALGAVGSGAGGVYLTNGRRDFAVVQLPLGGVRVHTWDSAAGQWTN